jgi:hypothetical protein
LQLLRIEIKMFIFGIAFFVTVLLGGCGIDTSSSPSSVEQGGTTSDVVISNPINVNPIVVDSAISDENSSDANTSVVEYPAVNPADSDFDTVNALEDSNACNSGTYRIVSDASYGGELDGENGASSMIADGQGLVIRSEYLSQDYKSTWVTLYHRSFPTPNNLNLQGVANYTMDGVFALSYDLAWADKSISGIDNIVYVQSDKSEKPACYRLTLDTIVGNEIKVQKVYRKRI